MDQSIEAVFENGVFRPLQKTDLSDGQHVRIVVQSSSKRIDDDPLLKLSGSVSGDFPDVGVEHDKYLGEGLSTDCDGSSDV